MNRIAVILFNLGGPDSKEAIEPFLFNFFTDRNIIRLPYPLRRFIAGRIASRRSQREAGTSYGLLGDRSPLLDNTSAQARALETRLNEPEGQEYRCFVCMRYWHPMAPQVAAEVKGWKPDHIVLLPLYPQFSTTTTRSSFEEWDRACDALDLLVPTATICCYPWQEGFVGTCAKNIAASYRKAEAETGLRPRILFSAHGLPEAVIKDGDPYQWQCEQGAREIIAASGLENPDWQVCYQSRVGPMKWIGPSTADALRQASADKTPVVILPHAFTQEHVETLVEIEIEYRHLAHELGVPGFYRADTPGTSADFIGGLADMVRKLGYQTWTSSHTGKRCCPDGFRRCPCA